MGQASLDQAFQMLEVIPFFAGVRRQELLSLAAACRPRRYRADEIIFNQGDPGDALHIVREGQVRISLFSPQANEIVLALFHPGDFFGELSLLDGCPRSATAVAVTPTVTLTLPRVAFLRVLTHSPALAQRIISALSFRLRHTDILLGDAAFLDVAARLAKRLGEMARAQGKGAAPLSPLTVRATQTELAAMVGAARESVNKELRALESRGLIRVARGQILLRSVAGLNSQENWEGDAPPARARV